MVRWDDYLVSFSLSLTYLHMYVHTPKGDACSPLLLLVVTGTVAFSFSALDVLLIFAVATILLLVMPRVVAAACFTGAACLTCAPYIQIKMEEWCLFLVLTHGVSIRTFGPVIQATRLPPFISPRGSVIICLGVEGGARWKPVPDFLGEWKGKWMKEEGKL